MVQKLTCEITVHKCLRKFNLHFSQWSIVICNPDLPVYLDFNFDQVHFYDTTEYKDLKGCLKQSSHQVQLRSFIYINYRHNAFPLKNMETTRKLINKNDQFTTSLNKFNKPADANKTHPVLEWHVSAKHCGFASHTAEKIWHVCPGPTYTGVSSLETLLELQLTILNTKHLNLKAI